MLKSIASLSKSTIIRGRMYNSAFRVAGGIHKLTILAWCMPAWYTTTNACQVVRGDYNEPSGKAFPCVFLGPPVGVPMFYSVSFTITHLLKYILQSIIMQLLQREVHMGCEERVNECF